jgi:hypothetical protein
VAYIAFFAFRHLTKKLASLDLSPQPYIGRVINQLSVFRLACIDLHRHGRLALRNLAIGAPAAGRRTTTKTAPMLW